MIIGNKILCNKQSDDVMGVAERQTMISRKGHILYQEQPSGRTNPRNFHIRSTPQIDEIADFFNKFLFFFVNLTKYPKLLYLAFNRSFIDFPGLCFWETCPSFV